MAGGMKSYAAPLILAAALGFSASAGAVQFTGVQPCDTLCGPTGVRLDWSSDFGVDWNMNIIRTVSGGGDFAASPGPAWPSAGGSIADTTTTARGYQLDLARQFSPTATIAGHTGGAIAGAADLDLTTVVHHFTTKGEASFGDFLYGFGAGANFGGWFYFTGASALNPVYWAMDYTIIVDNPTFTTADSRTGGLDCDPNSN